MTEKTSPVQCPRRHPGTAPATSTTVESSQSSRASDTGTPLAAVTDLPQQRRSDLRTRHARGLSTLMTERSDLRGVNALADFVDDAVRWSA